MLDKSVSADPKFASKRKFALAIGEVTRLFREERFPELQAELKGRIEALPAGIAFTSADDLPWLIRYSERACLPVGSLAALLQCCHSAAERSEELALAIQGAQRRLKFRQQHGERFGGHAAIISLGQNCLPWHIPGRWGLRTEEELSTLFTPFALAAHRIRYTLKALENDFEGYGAPENIRTTATPGGKEVASSLDGGAVWNHQEGPHWLQDSCAALRCSLSRKVDNFRAACRRPDAVFMLSKVMINYPQEEVSFLPALNAALERHTGRARNRIILTNESPHAPAAARHDIDDCTTFICCPYPSADYIWHHDPTADSPVGLAYELGLMRAVRKTLVDWGLVTRISVSRVFPLRM